MSTWDQIRPILEGLWGDIHKMPSTSNFLEYLDPNWTGNPNHDRYFDAGTPFVNGITENDTHPKYSTSIADLYHRLKTEGRTNVGAHPSEMSPQGAWALSHSPQVQSFSFDNPNDLIHLVNALSDQQDPTQAGFQPDISLDTQAIEKDTFLGKMKDI